MKNTKKFLISVFLNIFLVIPHLSFAASLVPCGGTTEPACDFSFLLSLVNGVIKFVLFDLAVPIAAIMCAYAGFILVTSGGDSGEATTQAKSIFTNAILGLVLAAAAWLIIRTVLSILGYQGSWIGF